VATGLKAAVLGSLSSTSKSASMKFPCLISSVLILCSLVVLKFNVSYLQESAAETAAEQTEPISQQQKDNKQKPPAIANVTPVQKPATAQPAVEVLATEKPAEKSKGTLNCSNIKAGEGAGTIKNIAYWWNIPADDTRPPEIDAIAALGPAVKYVTFEPDNGGWNNIR
jgi:hypothetical protein